MDQYKEITNCRGKRTYSTNEKNVASDNEVTPKKQKLSAEINKMEFIKNNADIMVAPARCNTINLMKAKIYVDKTIYSQMLIERGGHIICTHPSRFGKSVFQDTTKLVCTGNKELFKDYYIGQPENGYSWKKFPVINIDFATIIRNNYESSVGLLKEELNAIANEYNVQLKNSATYDGLLSNLITQLADMESAGYEKEVIILLDKYDSILNIHKNHEDRLKMFDNKNDDDNPLNILVKFFDTTKKQFRKGNIRLLFVTGVTTFALSGMGSGADNGTILNLNEEYSEMFGFTKEEIEHYFKFPIINFIETWNSKKENKKMQIKDTNDFLNRLAQIYNGYSFSHELKKNIYNPWSVYSCLYYNSFDIFWYNSGSPSLLIENLYKKPEEFYSILDDENLVSINDLTSKSIDGYTSTNLLLFQMGYLTIERETNIPETTNKSAKVYKLIFPNNEIKSALLDMLKNTLEKKNKFELEDIKINDILKPLKKFDVEPLTSKINWLSSSFKTLKIPKGKHELLINLFFNAFLNGLGLKTNCQVDAGFIGHMITIREKMIIFGIKVIQTELENVAIKEEAEKLAETALGQIKSQKYFFVSNLQPCLMVGIVFYNNVICYYKSKTLTSSCNSVFANNENSKFFFMDS